MYLDLIYHPLEDRVRCSLGVQRYNPELEQWELFYWLDGRWVRLNDRDDNLLEVSYEETWCDPVETEE
jgi:hypothetical protein